MTPASIEAATILAERYAARAGELNLVEETRAKAIASANAAADRFAVPLAAELQAIQAALEPWWKTAGGELGGSRKSIELGGCMVGTTSGRPSLRLRGDEKKALTKLKALRWAKPLIRIAESIDKVAVRKALSGKRAAELKAMGFSIKPGAETFYVARVEQEGTVS